MVAPPDNTPWGFIEWAITAIVTAVIAISGFVMRTMGKLSVHQSILNLHQEEINLIKERVRLTEDSLSERPTRKDISQDIQSLQASLENRLDQMSLKFDRLDSRIDSILNRK